MRERLFGRSRDLPQNDNRFVSGHTSESSCLAPGENHD